MRLKSWVKWLLLDFVLLDVCLITTYLYMLRIIEIGG